MALTVEYVQAFYDLKIDAQDQAMAARIEFAKRHVLRAGIDAGHSDYEDLVTLAVGTFMESRGLLTGALASKSIADVHTTYKSSAEEPETWAMKYKKLLTSARGLTGRIA